MVLDSRFGFKKEHLNRGDFIYVHLMQIPDFIRCGLSRFIGQII